MKPATSIAELKSKKFDVIDFTGDFYNLIGKPELTGSWIIWGASSNGKTNFTLQLAKYLTDFKSVGYNTLEEGVSLSMQKSVKRTGIDDTKHPFLILEEPIEDLKVRLRKRRSPDVIIIDSLQYTGLTYNQYKQLRAEFRHKLFIFISHADGKHPYGTVAKQVRYDSFVKIRVEGYVATAQSRFNDESSKDYIAWKLGAEKYWGELK